MLKHHKKIFILLFIAGSVVLAGAAHAAPCQYHNVYGWAWSENVGWMSFSCGNCDSDFNGTTDTGKYAQCPAGNPSNDYGVNFDSGTGLFSGYAWSDNIGWIQLDPAGPYPTTPNRSACLDLPGAGQSCDGVGDNTVSGWARAVAGLGTKQGYFNPSPPNFPAIWISGVAGGFEVFAQTFTTTAPYKVNKVKLPLFFGNALGNGRAEISIRETNLDGSPKVAFLCQGQINDVKNNLPAKSTFNPLDPSTYKYTEVILTSSCDLISGQKYVVVVKGVVTSGFGTSIAVEWLGDITVNFPGGEAFLSMYPSGPFLPYMNIDFGFELYTDTSGGWDGWIKLRGTVGGGGTYGVTLNPAPSPKELEGWAWGSDVIGWVSFNCLNSGVCGTSNYKVMIDLLTNPAPSATNLGATEGDYCFKNEPPVRLGWTFSDPGDNQTAYQVQVDNSGSGFPSPEIDSGKVSSASTTYSPLGLSFNTQYWWRLRVWDSGDTPSTAWITAPSSFSTDLHKWPNPSFSFSPALPKVDQAVDFTDTTVFSDAPGGDSFAWTIPDATFQGSTSATSQNPSVKFNSSGAKSVTLQATDSDGYSCTTTGTVPVNLPLPTWREIAPF